jgi:hypothetical protein
MSNNIYKMALNMKIKELKEKIKDTEVRMDKETNKRKIAWCNGYITKCVNKIIRYCNFLENDSLTNYEKEILKHELKIKEIKL